MKNSAIAWTDNTFNPWWGCCEVSPGCAHCYAKTFAKRTGFGNGWNPNREQREYRTFGEKHWREPINWNREAEGLSIRPRVFCGSMCDYLDIWAPQSERERLYDTVEACTNLTWLMLTKRSENLRDPQFFRWAGKPVPKHVWPMVTAENQAYLERRLVDIMGVSCGVFGLSCEPLLRPLDLLKAFEPTGCFSTNGLWVICGGESGPGARPMQIEWARSLRDQTHELGGYFFMKQLGGHPNKRDVMEEWPEDLQIQEVPDYQNSALPATPAAEA